MHYETNQCAGQDVEERHVKALADTESALKAREQDAIAARGAEAEVHAALIAKLQAAESAAQSAEQFKDEVILQLQAQVTALSDDLARKAEEQGSQGTQKFACAAIAFVSQLIFTTFLGQHAAEIQQLRDELEKVYIFRLLQPDLLNI